MSVWPICQVKLTFKMESGGDYIVNGWIYRSDCEYGSKYYVMTPDSHNIRYSTEEFIAIAQKMYEAADAR
jgi:hypothetical protein